jgi:hypothetical protein
MEKLRFIVVKFWYGILKCYARFYGSVRLKAQSLNRSDALYDVGLITFTKNEDPYILEWLVYHIQVVKVDHIILVDNNLELSDYSRLPVELRLCVTIIHDKTPFNGVKTQIRLLNKYINMFAGQFNWLGVIDTDEYIYLGKKGDEELGIKSFLLSDDLSNICYFYWRFYGPADAEKFKVNGSLILSSSLRAVEDYPPHFQFKSLFKAEAFFCFFRGPHEPLLYGGARPSKASGFLNHYYFRTEEFFELKRNRRQVAFGYKDSDFSFDQNIIACSQVKTEDERFKPYRTKFKEFWLANQPPSYLTNQPPSL